MHRASVSALNAIRHQLCPRCRAGTIFRKSVFLFPAMRERCPACDLKYEREEGYFLGAMYIGYALALGMIAIFGVLLWSFAGWPFQKTVIAAVLLFLPSRRSLLSWCECSGFVSTRPLIRTRLEIDCVQDHSGRALGKRFWKSRTPTHSGLIVIRTI